MTADGDDFRLSATARIVRRHDRDRFRTALFAPAGRRDSLYALYAFNYEIAKTREVVREPMMGAMRLQWWRDSIAAIYEGRPARRHEVVEPLAAAIRRYGLSRDHFERLIEARESDLAAAPPADLAALEAYAEASSAPLVLLALETLGERGAAAAGRAVGIAYALAGLLRALPLDARRGRIMLPADRLAAAGLDGQRGLAAGDRAALARVVADVARRAEAHLAAARAHSKEVPRAALPALLPAVIASNALARLARAGHDPFALAGTRPDTMGLLRLAWAAFRGRF